MINKDYTNQLPMMLFPDQHGNASKLETQFWQFHNDNPDVYKYLIRFAKEYRSRRGKDSRLGIAVLYERVRWEVSIAVDTRDFRLNNNHRAYYARLIMLQEPELKDIFKVRKQRIQSTLGPPNDTLPSGEHVTDEETYDANFK
jgi:hypothetical protein